MQKARKPIDIKISTVVAISAILHETDPVALDQALKDMTGGVSDFFEDEFAVLDVAALEASPGKIDWAALVVLFKRYRLNAVAVRNAPDELHAEIAAQGLSIDGGAPAPRVPAEAEPTPVPAPAAAPAPAAVAAASAPAPSATTMIIDTPVRAGQRIYAASTSMRRCADGRWPEPVAIPVRASSRPVWKRNWYRLPASIVPLSMAIRPNWRNNRSRCA